MKRPKLVLAAMLVMTGPAVPDHAAGEIHGIEFREAAPPLPSQKPALNEKRTARAGNVIYTERATGLPGARLAEKVVLGTSHGQVTIQPYDDLREYVANGVSVFCTLYSVTDGEIQRREPRHVFTRDAYWQEKGEFKEAGFYVCLQDHDGDGKTVEVVRIITMILKVVEREDIEDDKFKSVLQRIHQYTADAHISPKAFTPTTVNPDTGDFYEAVIKLMAVDDGMIEFRSELIGKNGQREHRSDAVRVPLSGPFPAVVTIPHPFEGGLVYYRMKPGSDPGDEKADDVKRRERAAQLEILAVEGDVVTYRVVRGWQPWRYWSEGPARRATKRIRWRPRS